MRQVGPEVAACRGNFEDEAEAEEGGGETTAATEAETAILILGIDVTRLSETSEAESASAIGGTEIVTASGAGAHRPVGGPRPEGISAIPGTQGTYR